MKKSKFTEAQIAFAIKQSESGVTVEEDYWRNAKHFLKVNLFYNFYFSFE